MTIILGKDFDNNPGGQMGEAFGRGLQALAQHKLQKMQERHNVNQLGDAYERMNMPRWLAYTPKEVQKAYMARSFQQQRQGQQTQSLQPGNQGFNPERSLMDALTGGGMQMPNEQQTQTSNQNAEQIMQPVQSASNKRGQLFKHYNIKPEDQKIISSSKELNDDLVDLFLRYTNNNPNKARAMSKHFGF